MIELGFIRWIRVGLAIGVLISVFFAGSKVKQAEWDRASAKRNAEHFAALQAAAVEQQRLNRLVANLQGALQVEMRRLEEANHALRESISRDPVTEIVTVPREDCPDVQIVFPDPNHFRRLFDCGSGADHCPPDDPGEAGASALSGTSSPS